LAHLKHAEADEANAIALLQMLGDEIDKIAEEGFGLLLRHLMALSQRGGEVLEADGVLLGFWCGWGCCWLSGHCVDTPLKLMRSEYTELGAPQRITRHFAQFMAVQGTTLRGSWLTETSEKCLILRGYPLRSSGAARIKVQNTLYLELGE